jgi:hypothetical protein
MTKEEIQVRVIEVMSKILSTQELTMPSPETEAVTASLIFSLTGIEADKAHRRLAEANNAARLSAASLMEAETAAIRFDLLDTQAEHAFEEFKRDWAKVT